MEVTTFKYLIGKTFTDVVATDNTLTFTTENGSYVFYHEQDCCESVTIESITGDLQDLVGSPIITAEEVIDDNNADEETYSYYTWTFYKFATIKGYVDVRWYGESNGFYSERVHFRFDRK